MLIPLSIVIPSRRQVDLLRLCLASVIRQAPPNSEIIVVDDGSAGACVSLLALQFSPVRVIRLPRSRGFCVAANRGINAAQGEIIELLNDDTQVDAGWATAALKCFGDASVGAVAPLVLKGEPSEKKPRIDSAGDGYDRGGFAWKRENGKPLTELSNPPRYVAAASGSSVFLRRSALSRVGLFPEHFGAYFEDVDLSLRLQAAGYRIRFEPASVVWHRSGCSYGGASRRLIERQSCNEERLFWRNVNVRTGSTIARHAAVLAAKALRRWREGTFGPFAIGRLRAVLDGHLFDPPEDNCTWPKLSPRHT